MCDTQPICDGLKFRPGRAATGLFLAALSLSLAGCISLGAEPPPSLLTLTPTNVSPAGAGPNGTMSGAIMVMELEAPAKLEVQRLPVQIDDANIAYLKDAYWVEQPARLFRRLLGETIRTRSGRIVVDTAEVAAMPTDTVRGTLREFGYDARSQSVIVRFDAIRSGAGDQVRTRRFESIVPGVAAEAGPVGAAMNTAANDVAGQVADWVG
ncbi:ABC-type transport auxiliary lipoprotein family protein [Allopontixanthobacter sp.]|uniref:ABC-type transport auxiliary lipoprotein family protein n=1 Tax=Allopontixanthobacter sp. TaxID=2906452 RepID=UPI002ABB9166|nr:ABC-type transport auxiliary lipoprotein family protein [Allopontixanthobacter sp.]MDZ4308193.1 ABC-type transport auxiliary lipoprotein family protein [Allopontixanthobacter sp.]